MSIKIFDKKFQNSYPNFLEHFDTLFSKSGRIYRLSFWCKEDALCHDLFEAIKFMDNKTNTFVIPSDEVFNGIMIFYVAYSNEGISSVKSVFNRAITIANSIEEQLTISGMDFNAYQIPQFSNTPNTLESIKKLLEELKQNEYVGNLAHPRDEKEGYIIDWEEDGYSPSGFVPKNLPMQERFLTTEMLSSNSIKMGFYACKEKSIAADVSKFSSYLPNTWKNDKSKDWFCEFYRKNILEEVEECVTVYYMQDRKVEKAMPIFYGLTEDILKEKAKPMYNETIINSPFALFFD